MSKSKRNIGAEILEGIREIKRGEYGRVTKVPPVADVREKTGLSQSESARLLGVSVRTLQEWEQGRRAPSGGGRSNTNPHCCEESRDASRSRLKCWGLTPRWSGRVRDKAPISYVDVRTAQLNR